ncbi:exopolyphosphatase [Sporomusaceae bacterium FL31]|nr:exopolyphosphatase [Sporomusaceae bacterium FL31]GCE34536.1 exopolyphosphatase [Sporomusaceae bacterium]
MAKNASLNIFAAIHLGSEQVSVQIVQYKDVDEFKIIDQASRQVVLGEEAFKTGRISFTALNEICELLKGYRRMFAEYGVRDYRLIATTAVREAENRNYILDQIKVKTGLVVEIVDMPQEIFYKYVSIFKNIQDHGLADHQEGILFVDISSGGLGITIYKDGLIKYQQNIHIGILRIKESFDKSQRESLYFQQALAEYIYCSIEPVKQELVKHAIKYLVLSGTETRLLLNMLGCSSGGRLAFVSLADFYRLYEKVKVLNLPQIMKEFSLNEAKAEMVLPTIVLYKQILGLTDIAEIVIPADQFIDGISIIHITEKTQAKWFNMIDKQVIGLACALGEKYQYDAQHAAAVESHALCLFDRMAKVHGLGKRERMMIQVACILHDIGKFVSLRQHYFYSYQLIKSSDIIGFSDIEKAIIANVAQYHSKGIPASGDPKMAELTNEQKVTVGKLAAIVRLADAIDRAHRQKNSSLDVVIKGDEMIITVAAKVDMSLEEWTFLDKVSFFESVFGIRATLVRETR